MKLSSKLFLIGAMLSLMSLSIVQAQSVSMGVLPGAEWIAIGTRNNSMGMISMSNSTFHYYDLEAGMAVVEMQTWREQFTDNLTYYEEDRLQIDVTSFTSVVTTGNESTFRALPYLCTVDWGHNINEWNQTAILLEKVGILLQPVEYIEQNVTIRNAFGEYSYSRIPALLFEVCYENSTDWEEYIYLQSYGIMQKHSWSMFGEWGTWETKILKLSTRDVNTPEPVNPLFYMAIIAVVGVLIVAVVLIYTRMHDSGKEEEMVKYALEFTDDEEDDEW